MNNEVNKCQKHYHVKKNDKVQVISGGWKNKTAKVVAILLRIWNAGKKQRKEEFPILYSFAWIQIGISLSELLISGIILREIFVLPEDI